MEGGVDAISDAPHFAAIVDSLEAETQTDGRGSLLVSSGDHFIGGPFFSAFSFEPATGFTLVGAASLDEASGSVSGIALNAKSPIEAGGPFLLGRV